MRPNPPVLAMKLPFALTIGNRGGNPQIVPAYMDNGGAFADPHSDQGFVQLRRMFGNGCERRSGAEDGYPKSKHLSIMSSERAIR